MSAPTAKGALLGRVAVATALLPITWGWALPRFMLLDPLASQGVLVSGGVTGAAAGALILVLAWWRLRGGSRSDFAYEAARDLTVVAVAAAVLRWALDSEDPRMPYVESFSLFALQIGIGLAFAVGVYVACRKEARRHLGGGRERPLPGLRRVFTVTGAALGLIAAIVIGVGTAARSDGALDRARVDELNALADVIAAGVSAANSNSLRRRIQNVAAAELAASPERLSHGERPRWFESAAALAENDDGWVVLTADGRRLHVTARAVPGGALWMTITANTRPPLRIPNDVSALLTLAVFLLLAPLAAWLVANDLSRQLVEITRSLHRLGPSSPSEADREVFTSNLDRTRTELTDRPGIPVTSNDEAGDLALELNAACRRFTEENRRLAQALSATQHSDRAQSLLLQATSHDLRTPLTSVAGFCHLLQKGDLSTSQREDVRVIADAAAQLQSHVEEILDLSRIEAGQEAPLKIEPLDVGDLARDVLATRGNSAATAVTVQLSVSPDLFLIKADGQRIRQVLENLVSNALKFTTHGFVDVTLTPDTMVDGRPAIHLQVRDTGPGIAESELDAIFEEFYRVADRRAVAGTGLGLAIARRLVERHGGRIWAESVLGQGSVFHLLLPETAV